MAIRLTHYYYFKMRDGEPYDIEVSILPKRTNLLATFVEMTDEQREFYIGHPNATVMQVWNCSMEEPVEPDEPVEPSTDDESYYYFKIRNGNPYQIKVEPFEINTTIMRMYVEMTAEQKAFYLEHPTASVMEVWNCEITPPYVPPTPELQEYIAQRVKDLKDACYGAITIDKVQCEMANCVLAGTSVTYSGKRHYTTLQAKAIMEQFMDESDKVSTIYETYKPQIEAASTTAIVDSLFEEAIAQL